MGCVGQRGERRLRAELGHLPLQLGYGCVTIEALKQSGFDIETRNHVLAVLDQDFTESLTELYRVLAGISIPDLDLIKGGGGKSPITKAIEDSLYEIGWPKHNFEVKKEVDGEPKQSTTHEIDHVRKEGGYSLALEIEWNNKDQFFDRDLENFRRLHAEGAISAGAIITRGASLQNEMVGIIRQCAEAHSVEDFDDLPRLGPKTAAHREEVRERISRGVPFTQAWAEEHASKFGQSTTHWIKLQERLNRGVGNPCPLLLIGIPSSVVRRSNEHQA